MAGMKMNVQDTEKLFAYCYDTAWSASVNEVISHIRNKIILQQYPSGAQITEQQLADECGVSRGSVRTAFQELEREGLIEALSTGRKRVTGFSLKYLDNLYEMREFLELSALRALLGNAQSGEREQQILEAAIPSVALRFANTSRDPIEMVRTDAEFHRTIIRASGNRASMQCWNTIEPVIWAVLSVNAVFADAQKHLEEYQKHKELAVMLLMKDPRATEALKSHIGNSHIMAAETLKMLGCK